MSVWPPPPPPPELIGGPDGDGCGTVLAFVAMWLWIACLIYLRH